MKKLMTSWTFDASAKTIDLVGISSDHLEQILVITNTTDNIIIYNFADPAKGGTLSGNTLTLDYDTTSMSDTDALQIWFDTLTEPLEEIQTNTNATTNAISSVLQDSTFNQVASDDAADVTGSRMLIVGGKDVSGNGQMLATETDGKVIISDGGGSVTVDNGGITTIAGAVSGSEMQVDVVTSALPSGAATSAKQDALLTELQLKADLSETQPVSLASVPSHAVTNAGTFATQATLQTSSAQIGHLEANQSVNNAQVAGTTTSTGNGTTDAGTQRVTISSDSTGAPFAKLKDASGNNTSVQTMGDTMAAAATTTLGVAAFNAVYNGTNYVRQRGDATDGTLVNLGTNNDVTLNAGTNAIGKLAANSGVDIGDVDVTSLPVAFNSGATSATTQRVILATDTTVPNVTGNVAHDGVDSGNPVLGGNRAIAHGTNPTAVAAADRTVAYANRAGVPFVIGGHPNPVTKHINVTDADGAQTDTALVTVGAGTKIVVTALQVTADGANTVDVGYRLGFGTANTPANDANSGMVSTHPGLKAGSGLTIGNGGGMLAVGGDNEDLRLTCEDPVTGALDLVVTYYTIES